MNQISSIFRVFIAGMALALFALPASAAQPIKNYKLVMSSTIAADGIVTAAITNVSPTGNSAINSFIINRPANTTLSNPYTPTSGVTFSLDAGGNLKVNGFKGLLPQDQSGSHTLTITFKLTATTSCATSIPWSASVYTGNSWNGDTFALVAAQSSLNSSFPSNACYTVTYNGNGSTGGSVPLDGNSYPISALVTVKTNSGSLVKSGFKFVGWNTAANGSGTDYVATGSATFTMGSANVILYAKWTPTYTVTYNGNGSTGGSVPVDGAQYANGDTVTVKTNSGSLVRTGYTFIGWNTAANGSGTNYAADGNATFTMGSGNVVLYAKWQLITNSVTYAGNGSTGGSVPVDNTAYANGDTVPVKTNSGNLVRTGYKFIGWNTATDGSGTSYAADGNATFTMGLTAVTLYAKWTPTYTVTYNGNASTGGAVPVDNGAYANGDTVTVLANTGSLVKTGYTLAGWNTAADGSGTNYAANGSAIFTMGSANVVLYAKWTLNTLTVDVPANATLNVSFDVKVTFNPPNGGTVTLSSDNCTLNPNPPPVKSQDGNNSVTFTVTITDAPGFKCNITATADGGAYATKMVTIDPVFTGVLGCKSDPPANNIAGFYGANVNGLPQLAYMGNPDWGLVRALNNKDGNPCTLAVPFQFEFDGTNNTAAFIVPDTGGQGVAVEYVLLWGPIVTDGSSNPYPGVLPFAQLAWLHDSTDPLGKAWKFVPALACVEDDVELTGATNPPHPELVMPMIPNIEPFITLGTTGYPGYAPNQLAKMCVAQEGWTAVGTNGSGQKLRQYWHKVIDNADGGVKLSF